MGAERGSDGVMEDWSNGKNIVLGRIFGDAGNPIFVVALLFKLLDQSQQTVFDLVVENVELSKPLCGELLGLIQSDCASHRLSRRPQCDIKKLDVLLNRTPTVSFRNVR